MGKDLTALLVEKNDMIKEGRIVDATELFFADEVKTIDFDGTKTANKEEMVSKMKSFAGAISRVNGIQLHRTAVNDETTFAEFTFDFDMADGSKILWHEIIRSVWKDGQVVEEQYFKA